MKGEFFIFRKYFEKYISNIFTNSNDRILDIGCGESPYYHDFIRGQIVCFDIQKSKTTDIIGSADFLPFRKNSFDKIIIVNSLYYFKNPFKVVEQIHDILKENGKLVIITPFFYPIHDVPDDKYRFTEFGLRALLEDNFKVERIDSIGGFFSLPAIVLHSLIKGFPLMAPKILKNFTKMIAYLIFYLPYIFAQFLSFLDVLDNTKRWSTYYAAVGRKK